MQGPRYLVHQWKGRRTSIAGDDPLLDDDGCVEKVVEDEKHHALVSQEDKPLTPQPVKGGQNVRHSKHTQNNAEMSFVANVPKGRQACKFKERVDSEMKISDKIKLDPNIMPFAFFFS